MCGCVCLFVPVYECFYVCLCVYLCLCVFESSKERDQVRARIQLGLSLFRSLHSDWNPHMAALTMGSRSPAEELQTSASDVRLSNSKTMVNKVL